MAMNPFWRVFFLEDLMAGNSMTPSTEPRGAHLNRVTLQRTGPRAFPAPLRTVIYRASEWNGSVPAALLPRTMYGRVADKTHKMHGICRAP